MLTVINNRYQVVQQLGAGGMGNVVLAEDTLNNRRVLALKMIRADLLAERDLAQFKQEFAAHAQLQHPNLVRVYDFGTLTEGQTYFFTMEYVSGDDWATLAARYRAAGVASRIWLYDIIVQICRALQYVHSRGFIHYDVKPRNVRITPEGQVKLMDFGLIGQPHGDGLFTARGTPEYIAPELIQGLPVDHRVDLYSLGVSLYEIVTGALPFGGDSKSVILQQHLTQPVMWPDEVAANVPQPLQTLIHTLLEKDPDDRYKSANEVIRVINALTGSDFPEETRETRQGYVQSGSFVGREFELARFQGLLMRASQGQGRLVFISGAAGVGKSRLIHEVRLRAQMQRVLVCEGACHEHARTPYRPWVAILRQAISYANSELIRKYGNVLAKLMPELSDLVASFTGQQTLIIQPDLEDQQQLLAAVADFLFALDRPLMLMLEDLHYADAETLELLDVVGDRARQGRLLVVGVYRDGELDSTHPLTNLVRRARRVSRRESQPSSDSGEFPYELLQLDLLTEEAVADLLKSMLGISKASSIAALPPGLLSRLMTETGGNPLFIESLMRNLIEEELLRYDGKTWHIDMNGLEQIPISIQEAVQRRLRDLDAESLDLLQWAAAMGQWIDMELLGYVADMPNDNLFALITDAARRHILASADRAGELVYRFSDDQMRMAIYNTLPPEKRAQRHARIGQALQARYPENEVVELMAWHFEQAGQPQLALRYMQASGDKARQIYANESAIQYYTRALNFIQAGEVSHSPDITYSILAGREDAYRMMGDRYAQQVDLEKMAQIAAELDDVAKQVEVVTRQVELASLLGNHAKVLLAAEAALGLARQVQAPKLESDSLDALGEAHFGLGELEKAYDYHFEALEICRELNDQEGEAHNLWHLGRIVRVLGRPGEAREHLETALELHRALHDRLGEADTLNELGNMTSDYARQREYYEQSLSLSQSMGDRYRMGRVYNNLALTYWSLGLYDRARDYVEMAVEIERELQDRFSLTHYLETLGRVYLELSEFSQAEQVFEEGRALAIEIGDRSTESIYHYSLGRVKLARGDAATACEYIQTACDMQQDMGLMGYLFTSLAWLGTAYLVLGDWGLAQHYTTEAIECLQAAGGAGEFLPQETWWLRYQVLKAAPEELETPELFEEAWETLENAYEVMLAGIATLSDEGLRRNYLNKVQVNRDVISEWTRQVASRNKGQVLSTVADAIEPARDVRAESERLKDRLKRVLDISVQMNETRNVASLLNYVMDQVIELSGAERGFLVLVDEVGHLEFRVARGMELAEIERAKAQVSYTVLGSVAQSRTPILLQDALTDERFGAQSSVLELNLRSVLCVPLVSSSELVGMIYADNRSVSGRFSQADLDLMMIFANQAATAIENARLYEKITRANTELETWAHTLESRVAERTQELQELNQTLEQRAIQLETSSQVGKQATSILELDILLARVVELIQTRFGYYFVSVWLLNEEKEVIMLRAGTGEAGRRLKERNFSIPLDAPRVVASVCRTGKYRLVNHVDEIVDYLNIQDLPDVISEIVLPLHVGRTRLGALEISSNQVGAFDEDDYMLFQALADQIAIAIRNAQSYEAEQRRRKFAELLERAGRDLSRSLDLSEIPKRILVLLNTLVPYERGLVLLRQEEDNTLQPVAAYGFSDEARARQMRVPIRTGDIFQQLAQTQKPLVIHDVTRESGWRQESWLPLNHSWLGVPLITQDQIIGMISMTRREVNAFSTEDSTWVQAFAAQAVIALENARLYAQIQQLNESLEQRVQERTDELNQAYHNLEQLDKTKSDFISVAAHELRTPLTVIKGYTQILRRRLDPDNHQLEATLHGVIEGTDRLQEIINSMLDVARIDNQTLTMIREKTVLDDIIRRFYVGFLSVFEERHLTLTVTGFEGLPEIECDPALLYKVFYNLIINAIKYTPDGGEITVSGQLVTDENQQDWIEIVVNDTGIGIDKQDQELIFEKFYQSGKIEFHSSGRTKFKGGGPGLGLAIARGIVTAHGGKIWVKSEGRNEETCPGSQFYVRLPVES